MENIKQTCVLVVGMHRTGTSTFAGILNILGVDLGTKLLISSQDNQKGYFEHSEIMYINAEFLKSYNVDEDGLLGELPTDWVYSERTKNFKEDIKNILNRDFGNSALFGLKDPRISILLPAYLEIFKELNIDLKIIISHRDIQDVVDSLNKRNGFPLAKAMTAYKYYYRIINAYSESVYHLDVFYDNLFVDAKNEINKIIKFIDHVSLFSYEETKDKLNLFIEPNLRHNKISIEDFIYKLSRKNESLEIENLNIKDARNNDLIFLKESRLIIEEKNNLIKNLEEEKVKEEELEKLKEDVHNQYTHINYLDSLLKDRDAHILDLNVKVTNIERSTVWKILRGWDFLLSLFFPKNSIIRNWYESFIGFFQNIFNDIIPHYGVKFLKKRQGETPEYSEIFWKQFKERKNDIDVLFVNHEESRTGAPRIIFDVAEYVKNAKNVAMVSLAKGSMTDEFNETFGPVIYPNEIYKNIQGVERAKKIIEKTEPKMLYVNSIGSYHFALAAKEMNIPVIFHIHELEIAINMMFRSTVSRENFKNMADIFISVSTPVYNVLINNLKCPVEKVVLIHEFVSKEKIAEKSELISREHINKELNLVEDEILVFCLGTFIYRKGADIFMKVAKDLKERGLNCKFVWIGSKPFKEPFMADFGLYSTYFTLIQEKVNPFPYLKAADILVLPSREDPFPLVVLESMSLGKPSVLFKDGGGIYEAVKDSGIIVNNFDIKDFANAIEKLIVDKEERERMGEKAVIYQEEYDSETTLPKIYNLIDGILDKKDVE